MMQLRFDADKHVLGAAVTYVGKNAAAPQAAIFGADVTVMPNEKGNICPRWSVIRRPVTGWLTAGSLSTAGR